jgi:hypothetical protein
MRKMFNELDEYLDQEKSLGENPIKPHIERLVECGLTERDFQHGPASMEYSLSALPQSNLKKVYEYYNEATVKGDNGITCPLSEYHQRAYEIDRQTDEVVIQCFGKIASMEHVFRFDKMLENNQTFDFTERIESISSLFNDVAVRVLPLMVIRNLVDKTFISEIFTASSAGSTLDTIHLMFFNKLRPELETKLSATPLGNITYNQFKLFESGKYDMKLLVYALNDDPSVLEV